MDTDVSSAVSLFQTQSIVTTIERTNWHWKHPLKKLFFQPFIFRDCVASWSNYTGPKAYFGFTEVNVKKLHVKIRFSPAHSQM